MFDSILKKYLLWWYVTTNDKFRNNDASAMLLLRPNMCEYTRKGIHESKRNVSTYKVTYNIILLLGLFVLDVDTYSYVSPMHVNHNKWLEKTTLFLKEQ